MRALEAPLRDGLGELGLALSDKQVGQLLDYLNLIEKWTRVYNLTAVREKGAMLTHHLLDCLAVVRPLMAQLDRLVLPWQLGHAAPAARLLDVGSGAGLPGVVLAICCPGLAVDCVDSVGKKAAFVAQAAAGLGLGNLRSLHERVERLAGPYQVVSARAFSSLAELVRVSAAAIGPGGLWMAMKGAYPTQELTELPAGATLFHVERLAVPGLQAERCLVWLQRA